MNEDQPSRNMRDFYQKQEQIKLLNRQKISLQEQLEEVLQHKDKLERVNKTSMQQLEQLKQENKFLKMEALKQISSGDKQIRKKIQEMEDDYEEELQKKQTALKESSKELKKKSNENKRLQSTLKDTEIKLKLSKEETSLLEEKILGLQKDIREFLFLEDHLKELNTVLVKRDNTIEDLQNTIKELEANPHSLPPQNTVPEDDSEYDKETLLRDNIDLKEECDHQSQLIDELTDKLRNSDNKNRELLGVLNPIKKEKNKFYQKYFDLEKQKEQLENKLGSLLEDNKNLKKLLKNKDEGKFQ